MAYNAPELLLVGAAQNLVLEHSGPTNTAEACQLKEYDDETWGLYDGTILW